MKKYILFNLVLLCFVGIVLAWIASSRLDDFRAYHVSIAQESATSAAQEIARFIAEKKRLVGIFGYDHIGLINRLAKYPNDEKTYQQLKQRIREYFPTYFTFTIANASGDPYLEDFEGLIGRLCVSDLKQFAETSTQLPRIHPNPNLYHFDIKTKILSGDKAIILFVSFHTDMLGNILGNAQLMGHEIMLIYPENDYLIEATNVGARINLERDDFHLTIAEKNRILFSREVQDTRWHVIDMHTSDLFPTYLEKIVWNSLVVFILFLIIILIMLYFVAREERLRLKAEKFKDEFLSVVSHELRTPITSITGSLGLMAHGIAGELSPKAQELVNIALSNSERLSRLINELLDIQKIEAGKIELDLQPMDIELLIKQCIKNNQGYAEKFGAAFDFTHADSGLMVNVDENRIEQVMANLLSNAVKYGAKQDNIEIRIKRMDDSVRTSVTDHGPGINKSFRDRVFEKFAQADSGDNRKVNGTGLGLSIVRAIIEEHGGKVGFESEVGRGTTFYIDLPLMQSE